MALTPHLFFNQFLLQHCLTIVLVLTVVSLCSVHLFVPLLAPHHGFLLPLNTDSAALLALPYKVIREQLMFLCKFLLVYVLFLFDHISNLLFFLATSLQVRVPLRFELLHSPLRLLHIFTVLHVLLELVDFPSSLHVFDLRLLDRVLCLHSQVLIDF